MDKHKQRDWGKIAAVLCAVLLAVNLWQLRQISDLRGQLQSTESNLQMETRRLDERLVAVQRMERDADKLVQNWKIVSAEPDRDSRSLRMEVSLSLKEWRENTAAELLWTNENGSGREGYVPLSGDGAGVFTGTLELPLAGLSGGNRLDVKITNGETARRESLGYLGDAATLLPVQCYSYGVGGPTLSWYASRPDLLTISDCDVNLEGCKGEPLPDLSNQVFRLRRNGKIAEETTAMYGETIGQYTCEEMSIEVQPGDEMELTFFCRDESGLGYEFFLNGWEIDENGIKDAVSSSPEADWPRLTWD